MVWQSSLQFTALVLPMDDFSNSLSDTYIAADGRLTQQVWFARLEHAAGPAVRLGPARERRLPAAARPARPATARASSGIMQDVTTLRSMLHGTQDSPGVCWRQCALDLGLPVALPGAAGQPGCRDDGGLHHQARERRRGAPSVWSAARLPRLPDDGGLAGDRRGGRGGEGSGALWADQGSPGSR